MPSALREHARALPYPHDPVPLQALAAELPEEFVEALTLAGAPAEVAAELTRLAHGGITRFIAAPVAADGRIEGPLERFQAEVMPRVRNELTPYVAGAMIAPKDGRANDHEMPTVWPYQSIRSKIL